MGRGFYKLAGVVIGSITGEGERIVVKAAVEGAGVCPACGQESARA